MNITYYNVAGHVFSLTTPDDHRNDMQPYEPFLTEATDDTAFRLEIVDELPAVVFHEELRQEDEGQTIIAGHLVTGEPYFEFWLGSRLCSTLVSSTDYKEGQIQVKDDWVFGVNNAIMVMSKDKKKVGYVPEKDNIIFARLMDAGKLIFGRVEEKEKVDDWIKISIKVFMKDV